MNWEKWKGCFPHLCFTAPLSILAYLLSPFYDSPLDCTKLFSLINRG